MKPKPVLVVTAATAASLAVLASVGAIVGQQTPTVEVETLANNVYLYTYNTHRSLFVVTDQGVLATDPQSPDAAERYVQEIRRITSAPIRYLVYSHHHGDHVSGGDAFPAETTVIAQRNAARHATPGSGIRPVDVAFDTDTSVFLGDLEVRLVYPGPSETDSNIIVWVPDRRVAFMVDAVSVRTVPWRNMADGEPRSWTAALERLDEIDFDILAPGHGPTGRKQHVGEYVQYMRDLTQAVMARMDRGESLEQIQANLELPQYASWTRYDQHFALNIEGVYRALSRR